MPPDLELAMMGVKALAELIGDGTAKVEGNAAILEQLAATLMEGSIGRAGECETGISITRGAGPALESPTALPVGCRRARW